MIDDENGINALQLVLEYSNTFTEYSVKYSVCEAFCFKLVWINVMKWKGEHKGYATSDIRIWFV